MSCDGLMGERSLDFALLKSCVPQQQGQAEATQSMKSACHKQIAWFCMPAVQLKGALAAEGRHGDQPLRSCGAVTPKQCTAVLF